MIEINDEFVDITDLPQNQYEHFLEITQSLKAVYEAIMNERKKSIN